MRKALTAALLAVLAAASPLMAAPADGDRVREAARILGGGSGRPLAEAMPLLEKAAARGDAGARYMLGMLYQRGALVPQSPQRAARLLAQAAGQGHAEAQAALGLMLAEGQGVPRDEARAAAWFAKAADQGNAAAEANLGLMLLEGRGVARDDGRAEAVLRRAAGKGALEAMHALGWLAQSRQDRDEALRWYDRAAGLGHARAQYNLGLLLAASDPAAAVKWLALAGVSSDPEARRRAEQRLFALNETAPSAETALGLRQARDWLGRN